ncbi:MAG TPA: S-adenosylmethionine:tRNA ribosyltransferase-isomerase [Chitinophagaceae bacterium]|nr:S-adenosylmethionine:tRNA ribosyltransferase-isomerase [Chitinophagaceae bacterium]
MDTRSISINDYTYTLPEEKIARHPLPERDASKLLVYNNGNIVPAIYRDIDRFLPADSLLIFNNTRVVEARLLFRKQSGGMIEIFCLEPGDQYADVSTGMLQQNKVQWKCLIGGASKWKAGQVLQKIIPYNNENITLEARYIEKHSDYFIIELQWGPAQLSFAEILHHAGIIPLPPYIKRHAEAVDLERYQTVYAVLDGSVAAPTAGLHFTPAIFEKLDQKNIQHSFVTLHVGAGTFKPVKSTTMQGHDMHAEFIDVSKETIGQLRQFVNRTYAVGTTSARTIESLYWMGIKTIIDPTIHEDKLLITQWEVYDHLQQYSFSAKDALESLLEWMDKKKSDRIISKTQILIAPGYSFKIIKGLVTNFHQPRSTLLLLVAALTGNNWKKIYSYALDNDFRFLSYGDGCLILNY